MTPHVKISPQTRADYAERDLAETLVFERVTEHGTLELIHFEDLGLKPRGKYLVYADAQECTEVVQGSLKIPDGTYTVTVTDGVVYAKLNGPFIP